MLVSRDAERLEQVARETRASYGVEVECQPTDLADLEQTRRVEARLRASPFDVLVNNAGFGLNFPFAVNDVEAEQRALDVMVRAVMRLTHAALDPMITAGRGDVINVSSVSGYLPRGTYGAHKAWVTSFSASLHAQHRADGLRILALCPGFVRTEFHDRMRADMSGIPDLMWLDARDVADTALRDLEAGKAVSVPTLRWKAVVGVARLTPRPVVNTLFARLPPFGTKRSR